MNILVGDISSRMDSPNPQALAVIRNVCKARPARYMFMPKFRAGLWDGYISVMTSFSTFPTGMLSRVVDGLEAKGYHIQLIHKTDIESTKPVTADILVGITLRDYQVEAANIMIDHRRGILKMATNGGKTEVMAAIIKTLDCNTVVMVHRKELMYQTAERFTKRGIQDVGMIGDGIYNPRKVTVAMVQTLANKMHKKDFVNNKLLFVDEAHHLSSDQMMNVFNAIPGPYRFGVSGTPLKYDVLCDLKLIASTGDIVYELSNEYLIESGHSAVPTIYIKTIESTDDEIWKLPYAEAYEQCIVNNHMRNAFISDFANIQEGIVLILINRIEHGRTLQSLIPGSVFVSGHDSTEYRQETLEDMRTQHGVYIASPIFDEGIDVPNIDTLIIAGGGRSYGKLLQRIGRGMRKKEGLNQLVVLDFIDDTNKYLIDHSNERIDTYVAEGFATKLLD